jgi:hypothetical protein
VPRYCRTLAERFWSKVDKRGPDECWPFTGRTNGNGAYPGYGWIRGPEANRRPLAAHRISWELHNGPIPDGLFVLHKCDFPPCTNPAHLFLGTNRDNMRDAAAKGRIGPYRVQRKPD